LCYSTEQKDLKHVFDWSRAPVDMVFSTYRRLTGLELFIDSQAYTVTTRIRLKTDEPVSKKRAIELVENALLNQAGIVVTRLDETRVSITYNDKLPLKSER
jgi:type II secretory pathway component GspD/PulD (secretin)